MLEFFTRCDLLKNAPTEVIVQVADFSRIILAGTSASNQVSSTQFLLSVGPGAFDLQTTVHLPSSQGQLRGHSLTRDNIWTKPIFE